MKISEVAVSRIIAAIGCSRFTAIRIAADLGRGSHGLNAETLSMGQLKVHAERILQAMRQAQG